jgi:hypothetical protein
MNRLGVALLATSALAVAATGGQAQTPDPLAEMFRQPPASARPRTWWHWLNGNITDHGVQEDLSWMARQGIAGVQNFDGAFLEPGGPFHTPTVVDHPLTYMTPEWRATFKRAVLQADALGLDFGIASSPGWSESGGPWVTPQAAMKKLVWSETTVEGGRPLAAPLPAPPSVTGPFQAIPLQHSSLDSDQKAEPTLYRDVAVIAYRAPPAEAERTPAPRVTASSLIDTSVLTNGDLNRTVALPFKPGGESWVLFDYGAPRTMRALKLAAEKAGGFGPGFGATGPEGRIEASDDGEHFRILATLPVDGAPEQTIAFPATTARWFRVSFLARKPSPTAVFTGAPTPTAHALAELDFEGAARVHRFEDKAGFAIAPDLVDQPTPEVSADAAIKPANVIDLTARLKPDGRLDWTPPPGTWIVLRLGYSLIGTENHPASPAGTGLEVDKLSAARVHDYIETYLGLYQQAVGPELMGRRGIREMVNDSWEAGAQNWTEDMLAEFQRRRGYDARPWLPVLTGRVVGSAHDSDAFLFDFRRTLGEMLADNHYGVLSQALHDRGMARYGESHESGRAFIGDGMEVKKSADVPMSATWAENPPGSGPTNYDADVRESASVAHLYGQNLVAAESFTTAGNPFGYSPALLKPTADRMMANGLNRFVMHTSVHQPNDTPGPGLTLAVFGQWFTRKETWAEDARAWTDYLARSSALLQQGRFVADVAVLYPEDRNLTELYADRLPDVPAGYAYDFVNADAALHLLKAEDGRLVAPSGASYRVLVVDPRARRMSLTLLRKLHDFADAGVRIVGQPPEAPASLGDDPVEFAKLAKATFSPGASTLAPVLAAAVAPEMDDHGAGLRFVHRRLADGEIYFVANPEDAPKSLAASFRVQGHPAEIWRADTGEIAPAAYRSEGQRTAVELKLAAHDAVFVVFRGQGPTERTLPPATTATLATLTGGWRIQFPADQVKQAAYALPALTSWTESADPEVRYFSGTACYSTTFQAPAAGRSGGRTMLDLGAVKEVADVSLNGQHVGVAWKAPYRVEVGPALKPGANQLQVCVANLWPNRLIGDKQPGATPRAFTSYNPYPADAPLRPSGLLGPVTLLQVAP